MMRTALILALLSSGPAAAAESARVGDGTAEAWYRQVEGHPVYGHDVLGGTPEWSVLCASRGDEPQCLQLPGNRIYEDLAPRLSDLDGDGIPEIVVVETAFETGAALAVYGWRDGALARLDATPHIGTRNRWLAPAGIADLDGDGDVEIAYVETPHLGRTLRIWSWRAGGLVERVAIRGLSNHRIGDAFILGGLRDCGDGPEIVTLNGGFSRVMATAFVDGKYEIRNLGIFSGPDRVTAAMECRL